jgi:MFS family permease
VQSVRKTWLKRAAIILAIVVLAYILLPLLGPLLGFTVVLSFGVLELIGYAIFLVGMPLFLWVMLEAGYKVFIRPSWRVWHIRRIRNRRLLREAAVRNDFVN